MHPTNTLPDLGLSAGAASALVRVLENLDPGPDPAGRTPYALRRRPESYVEAEVARALAPVLPALLAQLLRAALRAGPGDPLSERHGRERGQRERDDRERSVAAAEARDKIEAAAARGLASYHRERVRPALLDLAAYMAGYDAQARDAGFPGAPRDWEHVGERIRSRLSAAREALAPCAASPLPELPRKVRRRGGNTDKLLEAARPAFLGAARRIEALALAPPPASPSGAQALWDQVLSETVAARAISRGLAHALPSEAPSPADAAAPNRAA